jgi:predicted RND superfamily exporter protein
MRRPVGSPGRLAARPFVDDVPTDPTELEQIRRHVMEDPVYAGNLVSLDSTTTALVVLFRRYSDRDYIDREMSKQIRTIVAEEAGDVEFWITGGPHLKDAQYRLQLRDFQRSLPLILGILALVLLVAFRSLRGVILPLVTIMVALLWTLAFAAWLGEPLNLVSVAIPPLLLVLGISYSVHVVSEYYDVLRERAEVGGREAAREALNRVWQPVLLTGLTTAAGFLATLIQPIEAVQEFGMLALVGVLFTVAASLTVTPSTLAVLGRPRRLRVPDLEAPSRFSRFAERAARFSLDQRRGILIAAGGVFALSLLSPLYLRVGTNSVEAFAEGSPVRRDVEAFNRHLEGSNSFNVVLEAERRGAFAAPENVQRIAALQTWLESHEYIGGTTSIVEHLQVCYRAYMEGDPAYLILPDSEKIIDRLLMMCSPARKYINHPRTLSTVVVRSHVFDTRKVGELIAEIETHLKGLEPLEGWVTGNAVLTNSMIDELIWGQTFSVLGALVLIFIILLVLFHHPLTAAAALVPNALPIAAYFSALAVTGTALSPTTAVIAPMALGIAVDDTIHYLFRFRDDARQLVDERSASVSALRSVGRPITITSIAVCAGFLVFTTSDLPNQVELGALGAFTLAFAWLTEFTVTPAICRGLRVVTLWDVLTDRGDVAPRESGEDPVFFKGLSARQRRIVVAMMRLADRPAGTRLMTEHESGDALYVVLSGRIRCWVDRNGLTEEFEVSERGSIVGEVAFFDDESHRSSNAEVVEDARLLEITPGDLDRLMRRYPWTGARVLHNLNQFQAKRLADRNP